MNMKHYLLLQSHAGHQIPTFFELFSCSSNAFKKRCDTMFRHIRPLHALMLLFRMLIVHKQVTDRRVTSKRNHFVGP